MKNRFSVIVVVLLAAGVGFFLYHKYRVPPNIKFSTLQLTDLDGNNVTLQQYGNKKIFLNFYATWCGPCRMEFPLLDSAAQLTKNDDVIFISVSDEPLPLLKRFKELVHPQNITLLHSVVKLKQLDINTVPTSYILKNNAVVYQKVGVEDWPSAKMIENIKGL